LRAAEKPDCSTCRKTWALYGKEPDCSVCIVPLRADNQEAMIVFNTTMGIKNLGLESIFEVMKLLKIKNRFSVVKAAISVAAEFKDKEKLEQQKNG